MNIGKCDDFETNCGNSDAECFVDAMFDDYNEGFLLSKIKLIKDPSICDTCVYNRKFEGYSYDQWNVELRNIKIDKILD